MSFRVPSGHCVCPIPASNTLIPGWANSWGCSCPSGVEHLSSMWKALGSISNTTYLKAKDEQINSSKWSSPKVWGRLCTHCHGHPSFRWQKQQNSSQYPSQMGCQKSPPLSFHHVSSPFLLHLPFFLPLIIKWMKSVLYYLKQGVSKTTQFSLLNPIE